MNVVGGDVSPWTFQFADGAEVKRIGFGAMHLTGPGVWGEPEDPRQACAILKRAVELGVTLVDTADIYGPEVSERLIAEALSPYPADLVVATKGGFEKTGRGRVHPNGRPDHLRRACEESLRRLRADQHALYQLHTVDPEVPIEESVGELALLLAEGKIRRIGLSNVTIEQYERVRDIAPIASIQNRYSIDCRTDEAMLRLCEQEGLAYIAYCPLSYNSLDSHRHAALCEIAGVHGATPTQVALSWLLHCSLNLIAIPGTSSLAHLEENVANLPLDLTSAELRALE